MHERLKGQAALLKHFVTILINELAVRSAPVIPLRTRSESEGPMLVKIIVSTDSVTKLRK
jgi:hypothetical protein